MKRLKIFMLIIAIFLLCSVSSSIAEDYDIAGFWNLSGNGYVDKSFVRVSLALTGDLQVITKMGDELITEYSEDVIAYVSQDLYEKSQRHLQDVRFVTGHIVYLQIDATNLDIKAWSDTIDNSHLTIPVPLPDLSPSNSNPFVLPDVSYGEDDYNLTYTLTLTSIYSGTVRINGWFTLDYVGGIELDSLCKIWKEGTNEPEAPNGDDKKSGCNSGFNFGILILLLSFFAVNKGEKFCSEQI